MTSVNIGELLSACVDLAERAGDIIREVKNSGALEVKNKTPGADDPFTRADTQAQELIVGGLLRLWPQLKIVGEEDLQQRASSAGAPPRLDRVAAAEVPPALKAVALSDVAVFVDPLDATKEFTMGQYHCCMTLIGIALAGVPVAGVMHQPLVSPVGAFYGIVGGKVHGLVHTQPHAPRPVDKFVLTVTASHFGPDTEKAVAAVAPGELVRAGGAGYKTLLVLQQKADAYLLPGPGTKRWDTCAPEALLRALGGSLTDARGQHYKYTANGPHENKQGVLASLRPDVAAHILAKLPPS